MNEGQKEDTQLSSHLNWFAVGSVPAATLLSLFLFTVTEGGKEKFGVAILSICVFLPMGALLSFSCSIYKLARLSEQDNWPG